MRIKLSSGPTSTRFGTSATLDKRSGLTRHVSTTSAAASSSGSSADFMAALPAAALDGDNCEIQRLVRLDVARKRLEHIPVRVPRRYPQSFKTDLYHRCGNQTPLQLE